MNPVGCLDSNYYVYLQRKCYIKDAEKGSHFNYFGQNKNINNFIRIYLLKLLLSDMIILSFPNQLRTFTIQKLILHNFSKRKTPRLPGIIFFALNGYLKVKRFFSEYEPKLTELIHYRSDFLRTTTQFAPHKFAALKQPIAYQFHK